MDDEVVRLRRREALLDESQAGLLLATIHQLRADKDNLIQRNQVLQLAATTQSPDEVAKAQAATIAAEERAADTEHQLVTAQERIAHLMARGTELEEQNQRIQSQPQAPADQALQQRLATAENRVQQLQSQVLTLNQQLLSTPAGPRSHHGRPGRWGGHDFRDHPESEHHGRWVHGPRASPAVDCWPETRLGIGIGPSGSRQQGPRTHEVCVTLLRPMWEVRT